MKTITKKFLMSHNACKPGMKWVTENKLIGLSPVKFINKLMESNHFGWGNWLIVRLMTHEQRVKYAIFAAEQVLGIYEKKYPDDNRPRKAIEATKDYLSDKSDEKKIAAHAAADAAHAAADTAYAAHAAHAAADAAYAAHAAHAAADAAHAAADAADAAADAAAAADASLKTSIIEYGINLISE